MKKFISTLQEQADLRELNDNIKDYVQFDEDTKKMKYPLETSLNRRAIQDLIMGIVDKMRIQKIPGDQLIQVSSSGFQPNDFKYTNATEDDIKKYGTNGLRFYHLEYDKDGKPMKTIKAQIKVALIGSFEKLLLKAHPDGKKIGDINRLNSLLKDENWMNENRDSVSLIGYRIPTQGHNSIENLEVAEFLPPEAGSIAIVPAEIVAKAGSDFDIDKLSIFRPSFDNEGNLINDTSKEGYANKIMKVFSDILEDPATFEKLIRPNDTDIIKPTVNDVAVAIGKRSAKDAKEAKPYDRTQIYRYKTNMRKFETLLSAKRFLSIFAVNNTFSTIMQQAGTTMNSVYGLSGRPTANRNVIMPLLSKTERSKVMKNGRINLGNKYDVEGNLKQDYFSQLINGTVDAASDDFMGYVNLSYENVGPLTTLLNQETPFDRAMWFLNQPVLLRYYSDFRRKSVKEGRSQVLGRLLGELRNESYYYADENGNPRFDIKAFDKAVNTSLTSGANIYLSLKSLKSTTKKQREVDDFINDKANASYNAFVLSYFISLQEQAGLFRNFQSLLNFDTVKTRSPLAIWQAFRAIQQLENK